MCDRIANSVSHNFKVPLNILKESISILKKKMETNFPDANHSMIQDIKNYTITISQALSVMNSQINDYIDFIAIKKGCF
jgi:signal transduction histidine kinase